MKKTFTKSEPNANNIECQVGWGSQVGFRFMD